MDNGWKKQRNNKILNMHYYIMNMEKYTILRGGKHTMLHVIYMNYIINMGQG